MLFVPAPLPEPVLDPPSPPIPPPPLLLSVIAASDIFASLSCDLLSEEIVYITEDACWSIVIDAGGSVIELTAPMPNPLVPNFVGPCKVKEPNPPLPVLLPPLNADIVGIEDCPNAGVAVCPNAGFPRALVCPNADVVVRTVARKSLGTSVLFGRMRESSTLAENSHQTRWAV